MRKKNFTTFSSKIIPNSVEMIAKNRVSGKKSNLDKKLADRTSLIIYP